MIDLYMYGNTDTTTSITGGTTDLLTTIDAVIDSVKDKKIPWQCQNDSQENEQEQRLNLAAKIEKGYVDYTLYQ